MPTRTVARRTESSPFLIVTGNDGKLLHVRAVLRRLEMCYEYSSLGNRDDPLDELFLIVLSASAWFSTAALSASPGAPCASSAA